MNYQKEGKLWNLLHAKTLPYMVSPIGLQDLASFPAWEYNILPQCWEMNPGNRLILSKLTSMIFVLLERITDCYFNT